MSFESFRNNTYNQHYVSQAEQRLNSCSVDPKSRKSEIYRFSIVDRKDPEVKLEGKSQIGRTMAFQDLFTLVRVGDKDRLNFENLFKRYEDQYPVQVAGFLEMITVVRAHADSPENVDLRKLRTSCSSAGNGRLGDAEKPDFQLLIIG